MGVGALGLVEGSEERDISTAVKAAAVTHHNLDIWIMFPTIPISGTVLFPALVSWDASVARPKVDTLGLQRAVSGAVTLSRKRHADWFFLRIRGNFFFFSSSVQVSLAWRAHH